MQHRLQQPDGQDDDRQDQQDMDQALVGNVGFPPVATPAREPQDDQDEDDE